MNREVIKEFIQSDMTKEKMLKQMRYLLSDEGRYKVKSEYKLLSEKLNSENVSFKVAEFILRNV